VDELPSKEDTIIVFSPMTIFEKQVGRGFHLGYVEVINRGDSMLYGEMYQKHVDGILENFPFKRQQVSNCLSNWLDVRTKDLLIKENPNLVDSAFVCPNSDKHIYQLLALIKISESVFTLKSGKNSIFYSTYPKTTYLLISVNVLLIADGKRLVFYRNDNRLYNESRYRANPKLNRQLSRVFKDFVKAYKEKH
jgi:hypothetical protein